MSYIDESGNKQESQRVLELLRNPKINAYTSDYIVQLLNKDSLVKVEEFMRKCKTFKITNFMRFFRELLPFDHQQIDANQQFYICHALFKLFQQICNSKKKTEISFSDISSYIAEKMPNFTQQSIIQQKMLPLGLDIEDQHKIHIIPPKIYGQVVQDRCFLSDRPIKSDKIQHLGRDVGQTEYSNKFNIFFTIDKPSPFISVLDSDLNIIKNLKTQQEITKRDMIVNYIAWSDRQQKIACILGNYSISIWSHEDNYKYEVNTALPPQFLSNPFIIIKYMDSMRKWIALDNKPNFYILSSKNYEPEYIFSSPKLKKKKQAQKILLVQLQYVQILCVGFERSIFLISLKNKQIVTELTNFRTSVTSIAFSQSYQALFISTYENYFKSYQLSEYQDLMQRGTFEGHKSQISLIGVIENKPVVFSIQQNSILKLFDIRDYTCYQSISVLKNVIYKQVIPLQDAICLVGSKMHIYLITKQLTFRQSQRVLYISSLHGDLLVVTNKCIKMYDIRNGSLKAIVKAIFGDSSQIYSVFCLEHKQKLMVQNQQGECAILQTNQMSEIQRWKLQAKPTQMHYDSVNDLLTQISFGTININLYFNQFCQFETRRQIINKNDGVRFIKVSVGHDIIAVCYENDDNLYLYAYQKAKLLGFLNFGEKKIIKYQNAYKQHKNIHRIVSLQFYQNKNVMFLLLSNQFIILSFKRTPSNMTFQIKKSVELWENPLTLPDNKQYIYNEQQFEQPLFSTSLTIFQKIIIITSNKIKITVTLLYNLSQVQGIQNYTVLKDNYNPHRIGIQQHTALTNIHQALEVVLDYSNVLFEIQYHVYEQNKLSDYVLSAKVGNLLLIADDLLNIIILQSSNWNKIAGIINCENTLPKLWDIFKYSEQQIKQVQFVLSFIQNENRLPSNHYVKGIVDQNIQIKQIQQRKVPRITITQLIKQHLEKTSSFRGFRSCSLREKKMVLEKQRDERQMIQNFAEQQKIDQKDKTHQLVKSIGEKQINETLAYLNVNHNENILKKGIIQQDYPAIRALEKKLSISINKDDRISIDSFKSNEFMAKIKNKVLIQGNTTTPARDQKMFRTLSTQTYDNMTETIGLRRFNSRQFIESLNIQRNKSKQIRSVSKQRNIKLPTLSKN